MVCCGRGLAVCTGNVIELLLRLIVIEGNCIQNVPECISHVALKNILICHPFYELSQKNSPVIFGGLIADGNISVIFRNLDGGGIAPFIFVKISLLPDDFFLIYFELFCQFF